MSWDNSTSSQVSNYDSAKLNISMDYKFQWQQESLNSEPLATGVVNLSWDDALSNWIACKRFVVQTLLLSLEFVIY